MSKASDHAFAVGMLRGLITKGFAIGDIRNALSEIEREPARYTRTSPTGVVDYDPPTPHADGEHDDDRHGTEVDCPDCRTPEAIDTAIDRLHEALEGSGMELDEPEVRKVVGRDPRLPPDGSDITKTYNGAEHVVQLRGDVFIHDGVVYGSLSAIAKKITGLKACNGYAFFGLTS